MNNLDSLITCTIVCCYCGRDHHSCYNCDSEKLELNP